jgi:hypothetical protein
LFPLLLVPLLILANWEQQRVQLEQRAEEEERTNYAEDDLMQDWEFKIVRCAQPLFVRRDYLAAFLADEARAGWQLVELFDAFRVRLKRLTSWRSDDARLPIDYDPYRLYVADPTRKARIARAWFWVLCGVSAIPTVIGGIYALVEGGTGGIIATGIGGALMIVFSSLARRCRVD